MAFWTSISTSLSSINSILLPSESILSFADGVGLYDGKDKSPSHISGRLHLTTHRLIYIDALSPHSHSLALHLDKVRQTEYWVGFLKSSPKITLLLGEKGEKVRRVGVEAVGASAAPATTTKGSEGWTCRVCGMRNVGGTLRAKCTLCGVVRDDATTSSSSASTPQQSRPSTPSAPPIPPLPLASQPPPSTDKRIPCPTCTFLNHHSMTSCEVCDSPLAPPSSTSSTPLPPPPPSPSPSPSPAPASNGSEAPFIRLSFRKGSSSTFYATLKTALEDKIWEGEPTIEESEGRGGGGIDAIIKRREKEDRERESEMGEAMRDLEGLMKKAGAMLALAKTLSAQLAQSNPSTTTATTTTPLVSSLSTLGVLPTVALTSDLVSSEKEFHQQLAKELGSVLSRGEGGLMRKTGGREVVGMDEVWCAWNRARGIALIPPSDLLLTLPHLPTQTSSPTLYSRTFKGGLTVLHTSPFSSQSFSFRLLEALDLRTALSLSSTFSSEDERHSDEEYERVKEGLTTLDIAKEEDLGIGLIKLLCEETEEGGKVVRDEQGGEGTRWFRNVGFGDWREGMKGAGLEVFV